MSITAQTANVIPTMLEQVRPKLSYFLAQKQSKFANLFNKAAEKHQVSAFTDAASGGSPTYSAGGPVLAWRVPVLLNIGGDYQAISLDGGDLGTGSMMNSAFMAFGTFENDLGFNLPLRAIYGSKDMKQAVTNALQFTLGKAISEMALYNEIGLFGDSTGTLAQANGTGSPSIVSNAVTYNLESTFAYNRIRGNNALVDIYSTANLLLYAGARVSNIGFANNTITVKLSAGGSYSPTNTDQIMFPNMGLGASAGSYTAAAGSWRNGIYTFNTTSTSGSLGGLSYTTAYELATPTVNGQSGFYTPSLLYSGKSQLVQRRDEEAYGGVIGVCHLAQRVSWYLEGLTISNWFRGPSDKMIDLAPKGTDYGDTFMAGDVTHYVSRYAGKARVDWLSPSNFGWTQLTDIDFIQTPEGQRIFMGRSASTGNPQAGFQFYIVNTRQLYSVDPGCAVEFYNLSIPTGQ
jgi:hypothetical protein